ncbi:MAG: TraR/DksA family transcriptional regulator [Terriglobales bacterium]
MHLMDKRQIQRFKTRLEIRQHELGVTIEHQRKNARMVEPEPDAVDQANSGLEKESLLQRSNKEQQLLRAVESALGRIRDGSFGQCVSCGNEVGGVRLEAVPWAPYCIQCQEAFER